MSLEEQEASGKNLIIVPDGFEKAAMEVKELFGKDAEVIMRSHNWPHWGNDVINEYMTDTAAVYKYIFAQTLCILTRAIHPLRLPI